MIRSKLQTFVDRFVATSQGERFLSLSEGLIKIRCIEAALSLGWTIQEGAGQRPYGPVADYAKLDGSNVVWWRDNRRIALKSGSADVAVVDPFELMLEIKSRPDHGTKSQAQFQEMEADVSRIASDPICAFLFVLDPKIYLSFSDEKRETRGRRSVAAVWFNNAFPKYTEIPKDRVLKKKASYDSNSLALTFRLLPNSSGPSKILVVGCREDAAFHQIMV